MARRTAQVDQMTADDVLRLRARRDHENLTDREMRLVIAVLREMLKRRKQTRDSRACAKG